MGNPNPKNQWPKGFCPNPKGRPRKVFDFIGAVDERLLQVDPEDPHKRTIGQIGVARFVDYLKQGARSYWELYMERKYGKPVQAVLTADLRDQGRDEAISSILDSVRELKKLEAEGSDDSSTSRIQ
jgi:hypothetical protein